MARLEEEEAPALAGLPPGANAAAGDMPARKGAVLASENLMVDCSSTLTWKAMEWTAVVRLTVIFATSSAQRKYTNACFCFQ